MLTGSSSSTAPTAQSASPSLIASLLESETHAARSLETPSSILKAARLRLATCSSSGDEDGRGGGDFG